MTMSEFLPKPGVVYNFKSQFYKGLIWILSHAQLHKTTLNVNFYTNYTKQQLLHLLHQTTTSTPTTPNHNFYTYYTKLQPPHLLQQTTTSTPTTPNYNFYTYYAKQQLLHLLHQTSSQQSSWRPVEAAELAEIFCVLAHSGFSDTGENRKTTPIRTSSFGKKRERTRTSGRFNTTEDELELENSSGLRQNVFIVQNSIYSEGYEDPTA